MRKKSERNSTKGLSGSHTVFALAEQEAHLCGLTFSGWVNRLIVKELLGIVAELYPPEELARLKRRKQKILARDAIAKDVITTATANSPQI